MDTNDFLSAVLPTQGKYCTFISKGPIKKNIFVDTIDNLYDTNVKLSAQGHQTYFALGTFNGLGSREAANAQWMRSVFIDMDCGVDIKQGIEVPKSFVSKKAAVSALVEFMNETGLAALGAPWLVDSGGGVHAHWPLNEDAPIDDWKLVAEDFKRLARHKGFDIDMTVTADAARVLRAPGTTNWKYDGGRPVVLRSRGDTFSLAALGETLRKAMPVGMSITIPMANSSRSLLALPGVRPAALQMSTVAKAMAGNNVTYFKNIMVRTAKGDGCAQIQHYIDHAAEDGMEPLWRAVLSTAQACEDRDKATVRMSVLHPYDMERMQQKLAEIKGPYNCDKYDTTNPGVCTKCRHFGKVKNPLLFGREVSTNIETKVIEIAAEDEANDAPKATVQRPVPPRGFSYGREGGVYFTKKAETDDEADKEIMLTSYDFFMTRQFFDRMSLAYSCEFMAIKGSKKITFVVPNEVLTSKADCVKALARNNIIAVSGAGCDNYMFNYVRACMIEASAAENVVGIPPRYGWQDDDSFAVCDTVYSPHSPTYNYTFVSERIHNLITATRPKGTLENWKSVMHMMRKKAATDPTLWGHLAVAGTGFGSILMQFMPSGSRAATLHLCSKDTGAGKTLAQTLAVSVWGDKEKYLVAPSTSQRTMMQRAGLYGSIPFCVDEITSNNRELNREWLPKFIFDFSAGMHKIKGSPNGNTEVSHEVIWSSIAILTSNTPGLEAMMGARSHTSEGEARRYVEWELPRGYKIEWTPSEREILKLMEGNYGVAGPAFAQWCVLHQDVVHEVLEKMGRYWRDVSGATDEERFWTSLITCELAGYALAGPKYAGVIDMPLREITAFWLGLVTRARRVIAGNQTSALDVLNAYIRENNGNFIRTESSVVMQNLAGGAAVQPNSSKSIVRGRVEYNTTPGYVDFYIESKMLKLHCADVSMGYAAFLEELQAVAIVSEGRKDLLNGTKGPHMRVHCVKVTRPLVAVQQDDL